MELWSWVLKKILSINVCDANVALVERVISGIKLLEKRCSKKSDVPLFWLYFIRLELTSPASIAIFPLSLIIVSRFKEFFIKFVWFPRWLFIHSANKVLYLLGIVISMKVDLSSSGEYIWMSFCNLYESLLICTLVLLLLKTR